MSNDNDELKNSNYVSVRRIGVAAQLVRNAEDHIAKKIIELTKSMTDGSATANEMMADLLLTQSAVRISGMVKAELRE